MSPYEPMEVAIRAFETSEARAKRTTSSVAASTLPTRTLILDCETTTDPSQRLRFGVWRLYGDDGATDPAKFCQQEGIFYADDLPQSDPDGFATLRAYVRNRRARVADGVSWRLPLLSRTDFVGRVLWRWAGPSQKATVVGYNLPFDLTRLATHAARGRRSYSGGTSLRLWEYNGGENKYRPRIAIKTIDSYRSLIQFTRYIDEPERYEGRFLDLRTLCFALTDQRGMTLEAACEAFSVEFSKAPVEHGAPITAEYIDYCRDDVDATTRLFQRAVTEFNQHPVELEPQHAYSSATLGKAYLRALGITPFRSREDVYLDPEIAGWGMAAYYGGRSECRIRRLEAPVTYCDFTSMYPTVNTLMGSWQLVSAAQIHPVDNTPDVRELLAAPDLVARLHDRSTWPILNTLVEVEPNGATLPVRARYDNQTWGLATNPYTSSRSCWYPLADVLATQLHGGPTPTIVRSYRLTPTEPVRTLANTNLRRSVVVNPKTHDFFAHVVEQRHRRRRRKGASAAAESQFLKTLVNATSYGTFVEVQPRRTDKPIPVTLHTDTGQITLATDRPEVAGDYCAPPIAACVSGAARLLLAMLEHHVNQLGGTYAFCDTDSMAIVATEHGGELIACPGGSHRTIDGNAAVRALSWHQVNQIIRRLDQLHPYNRRDVRDSILKIEAENFDPEGRQRELRCYAISAKRYQLTTADGTPVKDSEHGLGHLLNPTSDPGWIRAAWQHLRHPECPEPAWFDLPAISRFTVAGPELLQWFRHVNEGKPYADQIKPGNFLLVAHRDPGDPTSINPVAPYSRDPNMWRHLNWIDRHDGRYVEITTEPLDGIYRPNVVRVRTYRDILMAYHRHVEAKALGPDGAAVAPDTVGLLQRRPVRALPRVTYIGKEAHDLEQRLLGTSDDDVMEYAVDDLRDWRSLVVPVLRTQRVSEIAGATGVHPRTIQRAISVNAARTPQRDDRQRLLQYAIDVARNCTGARRTRHANAVMFEFLNSELTAVGASPQVTALTNRVETK